MELERDMENERHSKEVGLADRAGDSLPEMTIRDHGRSGKLVELKHISSDFNVAVNVTQL